MKIVFICGCLEPGRDGVGDYTRRLAVELINHGFNACAVALNDSFITESYHGIQNSDSVELLVFRIPASITTKSRYKLLKVFVDKFDPLWISFQFVPFAFHSKGLPSTLSYYLAPITKGRLLHLMVHELWVGMEKNISLKLYVWGSIQKHIIRRIFTQLQPTVSHSQIELYVHQMNRLGYKTKLLPLFSNIPLHTALPHKSQTDVSKQNEISFIVFGSIHPGAPIANFASEALQYSQSKGIPVKLIMIGKGGDEQKNWANVWANTGLPIDVLGEQPVEQISRSLSQATIGITTNPIALVGKSGTVAAMCEHGLPILCVAHSWIPRLAVSLRHLPGISEYKPGNLMHYLNSTFQPATSYNLFDIANELAKTFQRLYN